MVTRVLAAGQEDEEIRNSGILYLNEQNVKKKNAAKKAALMEYREEKNQQKSPHKKKRPFRYDLVHEV